MIAFRATEAPRSPSNTCWWIHYSGRADLLALLCHLAAYLYKCTTTYLADARDVTYPSIYDYLFGIWGHAGCPTYLPQAAKADL